MKKYKHVFFDLDHTLWDFEKNSKECLVQVYDDFKIQDLGSLNFDKFFNSFSLANKDYWAKLEAKEIDAEYLRRNRFKTALGNIGLFIEEDHALEINEAFLHLLPHKSNLLDGAVDILEALKNDYNLHIISNGWFEIQIQKMKSSEIDHYFQEIITNEKANARKPDKEIFEYALNITNASLENAIMVGDNIDADIKGAISAGMDTIFYNPENIEHEVLTKYEVAHLIEIKSILK